MFREAAEPIHKLQSIQNMRFEAQNPFQVKMSITPDESHTLRVCVSKQLSGPLRHTSAAQQAVFVDCVPLDVFPE